MKLFAFLPFLDNPLGLFDLSSHQMFPKQVLLLFVNSLNEFLGSSAQFSLVINSFRIYSILPRKPILGEHFRLLILKVFGLLRLHESSLLDDSTNVTLGFHNICKDLKPLPFIIQILRIDLVLYLPMYLLHPICDEHPMLFHLFSTRLVSLLHHRRTSPSLLIFLLVWRLFVLFGCLQLLQLLFPLPFVVVQKLLMISENFLAARVQVIISFLRFQLSEEDTAELILATAVERFDDGSLLGRMLLQRNGRFVWNNRSLDGTVLDVLWRVATVLVLIIGVLLR